MAPEPRDVPGLVAALQSILADLNGYADRLAREKAAPLIAEAQQQANEAIRLVRLEVAGQAALVVELQLRLRARDRQIDEVKERLGAALGYEWGPQQLTGLAAEVERRLAEDAAEIERLKYQILDGTRNAQMDEVHLPEPRSGTDG